MYNYKGQLYTINQLEQHPECEVTSHELRRNLWSKKLPIEEAMITPIPKKPGMVKKTWYYMGLDLSLTELSELHECKCSHWKLRIRLSKGEDIRYAIQDKDTPFDSKKKIIPRPIPEASKKPCTPGSISFASPTVRSNKSYTHEWICLKRNGMVMEDKGANIQKTLQKKLDL